MKRFACLCGGLAALMAVQSAVAQPVSTTNNGLAIWYDIRPTVNEITVAPVAPFTSGQSLFSGTAKKSFAPDIAAGNAGGPGDAQVCRISPRLPLNPATGFGAHVTGNAKKGFVDHSVRNIYAYITVEPNGAGLDQVISALGRDTAVTTPTAAGIGNKLESISVAADAAQWSAGGTTATVSAVGANDFLINAKSVKIPVSAGPVYDATGGAIPTGVYRVACITLTAGTWNKGTATVANSTYSGKDSVNNLLITRAVSSGGPAPAELPDFGYTTVGGFTGNGPEAGSGDGSTIGTTSATADFSVEIQMKGDFNNDGVVTPSDIALFKTALTIAVRQRQLYLGDFTNDGLVSPADIAGFKDALLASGGDCTTAPGVDCLPSGLPAPTCPAP